ncbi:MAG: polysaccharide pyruvyl transferase family protein [Clostridiales bacterium]
MKRFLLYGHGGAYNHGAEAIVKTTTKLIRQKYDDAYIAISSHFPEQDREYDIEADKFFSPIPEIWRQERQSGSIIEKEGLARKMYAEALGFIDKDTTCLSVGGDNFCYPNWHRLAVFQQQATEKNAESILWGCSVEPAMITPQMWSVLNTYTHLLTRESKTYSALQQSALNTDIQLLPDPAFLLEAKQIPLPDDFQMGNTVGINVSPLVMRREPISGILLENIRNLIDYILSGTEMRVALIPHVIMPVDNDYDVLSEIKQLLAPDLHSRIWLVDRKLSAAELKFVISKCRFLVCTRTHASIAAYSSGIPTLVIGYSVKAAGIAEDLGLSEFVIDVAGIKSSREIINRFRLLYDKEDQVGGLIKEKSRQYKLQAERYSDYI